MSHGHDDPAHARQAAAGAAPHGPVEIPPEPPVRTISPAGADLPFSLPMPGILWPVVWAGVAAVLLWAADRSKGEVLAHEGGEHAPATHGTPAHGAPAHGER
jgi:hypothetical protein